MITVLPGAVAMAIASTREAIFTIASKNTSQAIEMSISLPSISSPSQGTLTKVLPM
jgi:hypothetical protein